MTYEHYSRQSQLVIEKIQDLKVQVALLEYALVGLREDYLRQQEEEDAIFTERLKRYSEWHNRKMAGEA